MYIPNKKKHVRHTQKKGHKEDESFISAKAKVDELEYSSFSWQSCIWATRMHFSLSHIYPYPTAQTECVYAAVVFLFLIRFIRFLHFSPIFFWAHLKWPVCTINRSCWTFVWHRILCLSLPCLAMACNFEANIDAYKVFLGSLYTISRIYIAHRIQYKSVVVVGPWCICGSLVFFSRSL